jgi:hypothetical protein
MYLSLSVPPQGVGLPFGIAMRPQIHESMGVDNPFDGPSQQGTLILGILPYGTLALCCLGLPSRHQPDSFQAET